MLERGVSSASIAMSANTAPVDERGRYFVALAFSLVVVVGKGFCASSGCSKYLSGVHIVVMAVLCSMESGGRAVPGSEGDK